MKQYKELYIKICVEFCRLLIGSVFVFSGTVKAIDPVGGAIKINDYLIAFGLDVFKPLSTLLSFNLSALEFTLGICIFFGIYRKYAAILTFLFMSGMTVLTLYLALFDPVSDCGCFGDAIILTNWQTFYKNVVLLIASVAILFYNTRLSSWYTFKAYWVVTVFSFIFCSFFAYANYSHLPVIDFRPYKVGANIRQLMEIPEGAPQDEYKYAFIYEKNGVEKEFSLDSLPDSTWTFVKENNVLLKKGYTPPVSSFNIYDKEGVDVTSSILENDEGVFLLISPDLRNAYDFKIDEINSVYDYARDRGMMFWGVTCSDEEAIQHWYDNTGAEYEFLNADDVLLKTIIRSNPGLVLLKEGKILGKWHYNDIPSEDNMVSVFDALLNNSAGVSVESSFPLMYVFTFSVTLLLIWIYDYFRNRKRVVVEKKNL